jgi:hypothetical protein
MIVNLARPAGNGVILERLEQDVLFEGGEPHEGVLATFALDGREVSGRIIKVSHSIPDDTGSELIVTVEQIDQAAEDIEAEEALRSIPPGNVAEKA